jgi:predicted acetyltransferase
MTRLLISPIPEYEASYRAYIQELGDEERYPFPLDFDCSDFAALLDRLANFEAGRNLPAGYVSSSTYWLVESGEIVGVSNLRHSLNEEIRHCGGHIGLGIRPAQRGRGLGAELMALTIQQAWKRGIEEVHIHCYKSNGASASIIESNGGVLHSEIEEGHPVKIVQRFVVKKERLGR